MLIILTQQNRWIRTSKTGSQLYFISQKELVFSGKYPWRIGFYKTRKYAVGCMCLSYWILTSKTGDHLYSGTSTQLWVFCGGTLLVSASYCGLGDKALRLAASKNDKFCNIQILMQFNLYLMSTRTSVSRCNVMTEVAE